MEGLQSPPAALGSEQRPASLGPGGILKRSPMQAQWVEAARKRQRLNHGGKIRPDAQPMQSPGQGSSTLHKSPLSLSVSTRANSESPGDIDLPIDGFLGELDSLEQPGSPGGPEHWSDDESQSNLKILQGQEWSDTMRWFGSANPQQEDQAPVEYSPSMLADDEPAYEKFLRDLDQDISPAEVPKVFADSDEAGLYESTDWDAPAVQEPCTDAQTQDEAEVNLPPAKLRRQLKGLGDTQGQAQAIKGEGLFAAVEHHNALKKWGFTHSEIGDISHRPQMLEFLAKEYENLMMSLPCLEHRQVMDMAKDERVSCFALSALLVVNDQLHRSPLYMSTDEMLKVTKFGGGAALKELASWGSLGEWPVGLENKHLVAIASNLGGALALEAVTSRLKDLTGMGLTVKQVVAIASNAEGGGASALEAVTSRLKDLTGMGLTVKQVVAIASNAGGASALKAVTSHLKDLTGMGLTVEQVVAIAANGGSSRQALEGVMKYLPILKSNSYGLSCAQVAAIGARRRGAVTILAAVNDHLLKLLGNGYSRDDVVKMALSKPSETRIALKLILDGCRRPITVPGVDTHST